MFALVDSAYRDEWPICFRLVAAPQNLHLVEESVEWCAEQFGTENMNRTFTWGGLSVWFKDERLATLFRVRWC